MPELSQKAYNPYVHGFRGFAALAVFVFHLCSTNVIPPFDLFFLRWSAIHNMSETLRYGVELFFLVSGYVIPASLQRHADIRKFLADRCFRIYPPFLPVLVLIFIIGPLYGWGLTSVHVNGWQFFKHITAQHYFLDLIGNLFLLPTVVPVPLAHWPAWSLSYEWMFYLIVCGSYWLWHRQIPRWAVIAAVAAVGVTMLNFYPRATLFVPGLVLFLYQDVVTSHRQLFRFPVLALIVFLFAWAGTGVNDASPASQLAVWAADWRIIYFLLGVGAGLYLFAGIITGQGVFGRLLSCRAMMAVGTISYSFYLWSSVVIVATRHLILPRIEPRVGVTGAAIAFVMISFAGSLLISWLSWRIFEIWGATRAKTRVGEYLAARKRRRFAEQDSSAELGPARAPD